MRVAKINIVLGFFILLLPLFGFSQQSTEEVVLLQQITADEKLHVQQKTSDISGALIMQSGIENQAFINQVDWSNALIQQTGVSNVIFLNQSGYLNQLTIAQTGNENRYHGVLSGDGIDASILQQGDYNSIDQNAVGSELIFGIIQEGSHNEIQHNAEGLTSTSLKVYQRGNDMRIIINTKN